MATPAEVITPAVQDLIDELRERDYSHQEVQYDAESFGNALLVFGRSGLLIRLVRDRGQWNIEVAVGSDDSWFSPVDWHAFLESSKPSVNALPFDAEAELLQTDLGRIEAGVETFGDDERAQLRTVQADGIEARNALDLEAKVEEGITPSVEALVNDLHSRGYSTRDEQFDAPGFGDALLLLTKDTTIIRLTSPRSLPSGWSVEAGPLTSKDYFTPSVWHAFFEAKLPPSASSSFDHEAQLLLADLDRIEATISTIGEQELLQLQMWRSREADVSGEG